MNEANSQLILTETLDLHGSKLVLTVLLVQNLIMSFLSLLLSKVIVLGL